jgi:hypothetical protein
MTTADTDLKPVTWEFDADSLEAFPAWNKRPLVAGDWIEVAQPSTAHRTQAYLRAVDGRVDRPTQAIIGLDDGASVGKTLEERFRLKPGLLCRLVPAPAPSFRIAIPAHDTRDIPELVILDFMPGRNGKQGLLWRRQIAGGYELYLDNAADRLGSLWKAIEPAVLEGRNRRALIETRDGEWEELHQKVDFAAYSRQRS